MRLVRSVTSTTLFVLLLLAASDGRAQPAIRGQGICYGVTRNDYYYGHVNPYFNLHQESQTVPRDIK